MTVASGSGLDVAEVGRNIPVAVFCETGSVRYGRREKVYYARFRA
jgi:hypothetical protein